jgi:hypothetical protein
METKENQHCVFFSDSGKFSVHSIYKPNDDGLIMNDDVCEYVLYYENKPILSLSGKDYLDYIEVSSQIASQKFLHNQKVRKNNNE